MAVQPAGAVLAQPALTSSSFVLRWTAGPLTQDSGNPIAESSPVVANLDPSGPAVVVGDRSGYLYAYHLADGSPVPGWPVFDGGAPIDSTPSVAALGGGALDSVFVGAGNALAPGARWVSGLRPERAALVAHRSDRPCERQAPRRRSAGVPDGGRLTRQYRRFCRVIGPGVLRPQRFERVCAPGLAVFYC